MTIEDDIAFMEVVPTLRMLGRNALRIIAIGAESRYVHQGEVLFSNGEPTDCGYIVQEGALHVDSGSAIGEFIAGPGTLLGELALIAETKRPATATAVEPSTVIRISRSLFLKMLEGYPEAAQILRDQILTRVHQSLGDMATVRALLDISEDTTSSPPSAPPPAAA